ncbi:MAG: 3-oxoacyl-[acyl-carrier-protein] reductase [Candidatus Latescibacteria bacterium]|nr:3-oxoacyl-[acyl-carrier-protein] reductase [Candidatus Latescibacterota bacterium]
MQSQVKGKRVIITGAGSGIGKAIARAFAEAGALIAVCDINQEAAQITVKEIEIIGAKAIAYKIDVGDFRAVNETVEKIVQDFGTIEILINNAGITRDTLLLRMKEDDFDDVIRINLKGAFNFTRACLKFLVKERWGRIVNIASVIGEMGNAGQANYTAAKAGLIGLTKATAKEVASRNITVNAVAPGFIKTAMTEKLPEAVIQEYLKQIPVGREGTPEEIAALCLFLSSDEASYITGQVIRIDGGMLIA